MGKTAIEWTDYSWNPIRARNIETGKIGWHCEHVSEGCRNCYAEAFNRRLGTGLDFKPGHRNDIEIFLDEKMLRAPLRWKKPRKIFVCSMTDLGEDFVTDAMLDRIIAVAALCPQHIFIILSKRPERVRAYFSGDGTRDGPFEVGCRIACGKEIELERDPQKRIDARHRLTKLPLPNVWIGTSCEDQPTADERIPHLLAMPAAVRFVSAEPLLGLINFRRIRVAPDHHTMIDALDGYAIADAISGSGQERAMLDWIIVGGESGPHARPMHPDWARSLRDQCAAANVPFFFKQWGEWAPMPNGADESYEASRARGARDMAVLKPDLCGMELVGKKRAGRLLDGIEHNGFPEIVA